MTLCIISLQAHACASSPAHSHTPAQPCTHSYGSRVPEGSSCQSCSARLGQLPLLTPLCPLLPHSSTTRRSWTCLTAPATPRHGTANPTSKSTRMPAGASTPRGSHHASSAPRMRWVQEGTHTEQGWQLGATGQGCAMWGQPGGGRSPPGWECSPGGVLGRISVSTELHRASSDSLEGCFKVSFPAWCRCS